MSRRRSKFSITKLSYKSLFIIIFFLLIGIILLARFVFPRIKVSAAWFNDSWHYRQTINITNTNGGNGSYILFRALVNYNISALVTAGKVQPNLNDLRFVDSTGRTITYWIEDPTLTSVDVWIVLPELPTSGTTIYMYYGNPTAGAGSDINNMPTGGNITWASGERVHTFLGSGVFNSPANLSVQTLVVAGGGGGGANMGGGGGGGGVLYNASLATTKGTYPITVGLGGSGAPAGTGAHPAIAGTNGGNSVFNGLTALGGGWGGVSYNTQGLSIHFGHSGGSGGGSSGYNNDNVAPGYYGSGAGTAGQGYRGGLQGNMYYSGGGGGAGAAGADGNNAPNGGIGYLSAINGTSYYWGGGGGGASYTLANGGNGGNGGGGGGAVGVSTGGAGLNPGAAGGGGAPGSQCNTPGGNGGANTGGGGGGGAHYNYTNQGGNGGSGIVIIRYASNPTASPGAPSTEEKGTGPVVYYSFDEGKGTTIHNQMDQNGEVGLVSWWKMDEGTGVTAVDEMRTNNGAFSATAPTWTATGKIGNGLSFNGTSNFVTIPASSTLDLQQFAISAWTYSTNYNQNGFLFEKTTNGSVNTQYSCFFNGANNFYFRTINTAGTSDDLTFTTNTYVTNSAWNHIICSYDGVNKKIYVNGQEIATKAYSQPLMTNPAGPAIIGAYGSGTSYFFNGTIDSVKVYNHGLSTGEVAAEYASLQGAMINYGAAGVGASWADGAQATSNQKPLDKSLVLNGSSNYISMVNDNITNISGSNLTLSAWVKLNSCSGANALIHKDGQYSLAFNPNGSVCQATYADSSNWSYSSFGYYGSITKNTWHHIILTKNSSNVVTIYLDGNVIVSQSFGSSISQTTNPLLIGTYNKVNFVDGAIDEVKIYNYALTSDQIKKEYNRTSSSALNVGKKVTNPGTANLIGWWKFDEGSGQNAFDSSGRNNNGTYIASSNNPVNFGYTGGAQTYTIPTTGTYKIEVRGAQGATGYGGTGGKGGKAAGVVSLTAGTVLNIYVGGSNGYNGGAVATSDCAGWSGGGASDVRIGATDLASRVIVGGGGGATGWVSLTGVNGGGGGVTLNSNFANGFAGTGSNTTTGAYAPSGGGGTNSTGGAGAVCTNCASYADGSIGTLGNGGAGGYSGCGGGGGGGYYGGGGGIYNWGTPGFGGTAGGGGSSYVSNTGSYIFTGIEFQGDFQTSNGTVSVTPINADPWVPGKVGKALSFNGISNVVSVPDNNNLKGMSQLTQEAWVYIRSFATSPVVVGKQGSYDLYFQTNGTLYTDYKTAHGGIVPLNTWTHIAMTYDGSNTRLYINGVQTAIQANSGAIGASATPLEIGRWAQSTEYVNGIIDNVKIYDRALTSGEITYDYSQGSPLAYYSFNEGTGSVVHNQMEQNGEYGLVSWLKMDEASWNGTADEVKDSSGNNINGVRAGNANTTAGKLFNAGTFDGTGDAVSLGSPALLDFGTNGPFTFSGWVKPTSLNDYAAFVSKDTAGRTSPYSYMSVFMANGRVSIYSPTTNWIDLCPAGTVAAGNWYHVAYSFNGTTVTAYINGTACGSSAFNYPDNSAYEVAVGSWYTPTTIYDFNGLIDNVKIYNRGLSATEISADYNSLQGAMINYGATGLGATWLDGAQSSPNQKPLGKSLYFNGSTNYVAVPNNPGLDAPNLSVQFWLNPQSLANNPVIIDHGDNSTGWYIQALTSGKFYFCTANSCKLTVNGTLQLNKWQHISITHDGTNDKFYINGVLTDTLPQTTAITTYAGEMLLGKYISAGYFLNGQIDEFKLYNYAISDADVKVEYNRNAGLALGAAKNESDPNVGGGAPSALVGWWKMDEGSATAVSDSSGKNNNGLFSPTGPTWTTGKLGKALSFNGTNNYVTVPNNSSLNITTNLTIEAWIYPTVSGSSAYRTIMGKRTSDGSLTNYSLYLNNDAGANQGVLRFYNGVEYASGYIPPVNKWTHVAATVQNGTGLKMYANGVQVYATTIGALGANTANFAIGRFGDLDGYYFQGQIDNAKVYNKTLSQAEIAYEYNQGQPLAYWSMDEKTGTTIHNQMEQNGEYGLLAWWKMDEGTGTSLADASPNNNTAVFDGAPTWTTGKVGNGLLFNGTTQRVNAGNNISPGNITIEAWLYRTSATVNQGIVRKDPCYALTLYNDYIQVAPGNSWAFYNTGITVPLNTWVHVAFTYDGTNMKAYSNGNLVYTSALAGAFPSNTNPTYIGFDANGWWWNGSLDQIKIYSRALSDAEINSEYKSTNGAMINMNPLADHVAGKFGQALDFDGVNDYIDTGSNFASLTDQFTISTWVKPNSTQVAYADIFGNHGGGGTTGIVCQQNNTTTNQFYCAYGNGSAYIITPNFNLTPNVWQHLILVKNSTNLRALINTVEVANIGSTTSVSPSTVTLKIGDGVSGGGRYFNGQIDEFKIYNYALTPAQTQIDFNNNAAARL